jgi:hypothetical protein
VHIEHFLRPFDSFLSFIELKIRGPDQLLIKREIMLHSLIRHIHGNDQIDEFGNLFTLKKKTNLNEPIFPDIQRQDLSTPLNTILYDFLHDFIVSLMLLMFLVVHLMQGDLAIIVSHSKSIIHEFLTGLMDTWLHTSNKTQSSWNVIL